MLYNDGLSTIKIYTTLKQLLWYQPILCRLSTIKIYTTLKRYVPAKPCYPRLSTIKIYTTLKLPFVPGVK